MGEFIRRIHYLINRRRLDAELQNDMEFHREMAKRAGQTNFGNTLRLREQAYEAWGWTWLDRLLQDLRYGVRILARAPGFTLTATLVLAIGIGVNVSAFSLFNMVSLKWLPVPQPERIVRLQRSSPSNFTSEMSYPSFHFYEEHAKTLSSAIAVMGIPPLQVENDVQLTKASFVTANYFTELGTNAAYGRLLAPSSDGSAASTPAVVLSYGFWQRRFGNDPGIVGRVIHLNGKPFTVIGVAPYALATLGAEDPDLWLPIAQQPYLFTKSTVLSDWTNSSLHMWARLAPGVSAKAAEGELRTLTNQIRIQHPNAVWDGEYLQVSAGGHLQVTQPQMYQVAAMVGVLTLLILVVACANVGGLMLARAVTRQHEVGIRIAIGAGRWRIFRQLCTESLLLGGLGSVAALGLAWAVLKVTLTELDAPKWLSPMPDWRVIVFTVGMACMATLCFGLLPALQIARQKQQKTMARQILVAAQIAASAVLLSVAALLVHATEHALYTNPGFAYQHLDWVDPQLSRHGYKPAAAQAFFNQMQTRLESTAGVSSVSLVRLPPLGHVTSTSGTDVGGKMLTVYPNWVSPGFFGTMGIPFLMGRTFYQGEKHAVIVSESFARQKWPGRNPLGQTVGEGADKNVVIGVVADARANQPNDDDDAVDEYWSPSSDDVSDMVLIVRFVGDPKSVGIAAKTIARSIDGEIFPEVQQLRTLYKDNVSVIEDIAAIATLIGLVAGTVAGIGLLGIVGVVVTQRTKEIAIRMALGAQPLSVLIAVLKQFLWPLVVGVVAGTALAAFGSRLLRIGLYGVNNLDPVSYAAAMAILIGIAALSMLAPSIRTLRLDIAAILHHE
ncbi:MAG TPA: ABC transporter permease [Acidobacteriaceae bacterium]|nr:ABC transporter permease [Acidobacteriaceae bacterium]